MARSEDAPARCASRIMTFISGVRTAHGWRFTRSVDESIDDLSTRNRSEPVDSWNAALSLLDKYPWHKLYPLEIHPEFRKQVWTAANERFEGDGEPRSRSRLELWRSLCSDLLI
jgi:hypothetical protein